MNDHARAKAAPRCLARRILRWFSVIHHCRGTRITKPSGREVRSFTMVLGRADHHVSLTILPHD